MIKIPFQSLRVILCKIFLKYIKADYCKEQVSRISITNFRLNVSEKTKKNILLLDIQYAVILITGI